MEEKRREVMGTAGPLAGDGYPCISEGWSSLLRGVLSSPCLHP